ncbi:hypothetical protein FQA39_LY10681 [Lamprigera yunnana]|nr:hypothetical protein FQA39_LY10681 [Lamprigera yunnana]
MKALVFCSLISLAVATSLLNINKEQIQKWEKMIAPFKSECINESKVDRQLALGALAAGHLPTDENFKCYVKCLYTQLHFIDADGNANVELISKTIDSATAELTHYCFDKHKDESDLCKKVFNYITCGEDATANTGTDENREQYNTCSKDFKKHHGNDNKESPDETEQQEVCPEIDSAAKNQCQQQQRQTPRTERNKPQRQSNFPNDTALWPLNLSDETVDFYLINKPCNVGNLTALKIQYKDKNRIYNRNISNHKINYDKCNFVLRLTKF